MCIVFVFGTNEASALWIPTEHDTLEPLYSSEWNETVHHASSWERMGDITNPGNNVF